MHLLHTSISFKAGRLTRTVELSKLYFLKYSRFTVSFQASGVTATGGIRVTPTVRQLAPSGMVQAGYDDSTATLRVGSTVQDANGIVMSPDSTGQLRSIHYFVETALFNTYNRSQIVGWRPLGRASEGMNSVPATWLGQTIRVNAVFRDGLGKTENVFGDPIRLVSSSIPVTSSVNTVASGSPAKPGAVTGTGLSPRSTIVQPQAVTGQPSQSFFSVLKISDAAEGQAAIFRVERAGNLSGAATIQVNTLNGSAQAGQDYVAKAENLLFASGETSKDVYVSTLNDGLVESSETFSLQLRSFSGTASVSGSGLATASITNAAPITNNPSRLISTAAQDILSGTAAGDQFQLFATPTFVATTFRADRITNFAPHEGDRLKISRSAYRLQNAASSIREIDASADLAAAYQASAALIYDRSSGFLYINPQVTVDGSGGPIVQFDNKPVFASISESIQIV